MRDLVSILTEADEFSDDLLKDVASEPEDDAGYDIWFERYAPEVNPFEPQGAYDGCMFETYGKELEAVRKASPAHVWTLVSGDDNSSIVVAGFHYVNREGYFITKKPWSHAGESYVFNAGDPATVAAAVDRFVNYELGRDASKEWLTMPADERLARITEFAERFGMEDEVRAIVDGLTRWAELHQKE